MTMIMLQDPKRYCSWKQLVLTAELKKCARYTTKPWSSYDPKSQRLLSPVCRYWFEHSNHEWLPLHKESDTFSYRVEEYHTTLFHTRSPQNQYSSPLHLNKSTIASSQSQWARTLSVKHTKPVKAPTYTCELPDIGNEECIETVIEHKAQHSCGCML